MQANYQKNKTAGRLELKGFMHMSSKRAAFLRFGCAEDFFKIYCNLCKQIPVWNSCA